MSVTKIETRRQQIGRVICVVLTAAIVWMFLPGFSFRSAPYASADSIAAGEELFTHVWSPSDELAQGDGLGPVFNARSCAECHHLGGVGGAGAINHNVITFLTRPTVEDPVARGGLIHKFAVEPSVHESHALLRELYPVRVTEREVIYEGCGQRFKRLIRTEFDPLVQGTINTPALFGIGWIDRVPDKTIVSRSYLMLAQQIARELNADFSGQSPGRVRFLSGGRVGKFGWKAQFATVGEFVAAACANELGLGTPTTAQATPVGRPDFPSSQPDLTVRQYRDLVAFVDTLPKPIEQPRNSYHADVAARGKELFHKVGCAVCHPEKVGSLAGVYSDFLLHEIEDPETGSGASGYGGNVPGFEEGSNGEPLPNEWRTPPLWGVADSAPYFHDGGSPTLEAAINRHAGTAKPVTKVFRELATEDRDSIVEFLKTLRSPNPKAPADIATLASSFGG